MLMLGCGPAAGDGGGETTSGSSASADATGATTAGTATTSASSTTAGTVSTSAGDTTTTGDDDADDDDLPKWDHPYPDAPPPPECPLATDANATVSGTTPIDAVDLPYGWFAISGGGKCPYGFEVWFLAEQNATLDVLDSPITEIPDGLVVEVLLPTGEPIPTSGEFPAIVNHWHAGEMAFSDGTATIDLFVEGADGRLLGAFTVADETWDLEGSFDVPWCDLLASGPCGA